MAVLKENLRVMMWAASMENLKADSMDASTVASLAGRLFAAGCYEVCVADTIGCGTPRDMEQLLR